MSSFPVSVSKMDIPINGDAGRVEEVQITGLSWVWSRERVMGLRVLLPEG